MCGTFPTAWLDGALGDDSYLALERSFAMPKQAVYTFGGPGIGNNIEGMTWGPTLPNGDRSLVLVADDNFGQFGATTFYLLAVGPDSGI